MTYILFNPLANNSTGKEIALKLQHDRFPEAELTDLVGLDVNAFLDGLSADDDIILCGGDGTLSRFADDVYGRKLPCTVRLFGAGTGNDFLKDISADVTDNIATVNKYLTDLPTVKVNDIERKFINGIGYGIDGMACEVADDKKLRGETDINYTKISIGLCLGGYKCPEAKVTVDGRVMHFRRVWLASAMKFLQARIRRPARGFGTPRAILLLSFIPFGSTPSSPFSGAVLFYRRPLCA